MNTLPKGVYAATQKNNSIYYRASITYKRKHISLGSFSDVSIAKEAYLEADRILHMQEINLSTYYSESPLSFEKWVILINFKENGLYLSTPIYVRPKFFFYYLSPNTVLTFDTDELFFYSSHKIMKRNGHLFVADYGMQVNILNRYGIRSYSVLGKDYEFINGNELDFRHENIRIKNLYSGVREVTKRGKKMFQARINIPGYFVIGYYASDTEAAIAYNKSIDIVKRNGSTRNYAMNYIDNLSASQYADIYSKLKISKKIETLQFIKK